MREDSRQSDEGLLPDGLAAELRAWKVERGEYPLTTSSAPDTYGFTTLSQLGLSIGTPILMLTTRGATVG